ncbi:hypothetical protein TNCV_1554761 [Trichonephila clavipes]|nr:hypothetical protein TNCV_1554761 [Trichonephila clavipes]
MSHDWASSKGLTGRKLSIAELVGLSTNFWKNPEGPELANRVSKVAKLAANSVDKNDANLALSPRFRQVLIESPR